MGKTERPEIVGQVPDCRVLEKSTPNPVYELTLNSRGTPELCMGSRQNTHSKVSGN